jgi:hypothetical protein
VRLDVRTARLTAFELSGILGVMAEPAHDDGDRRPRGPAPTVARDTLADWITEDVIQQLYASRQDLVQAMDAGAGDVGFVSDQLLDIIGNLHDIATVLRGRDAGATRVASPEDRAHELEGGDDPPESPPEDRG